MCEKNGSLNAIGNEMRVYQDLLENQRGTLGLRQK